MNKIMNRASAFFKTLPAIVLVVAAGVSNAGPMPGIFKLANLLQSNMVIQQDKDFRLWGKAEAGSTVIIKADWLSAPVKVSADGQQNWMGSVPVPKVKKGDFTPHTITLIHENDSTSLQNILIGEVWLCSGQSNMEMTMKPAPPWHKGVIDHEKEIAAANYPNIRLFKIPRDTSSVLQEDVIGTWEPCSPESVAGFSGVAYYFGRKLLADLDIPVGLVLSAYGGASCQAFTSRKVLASDAELKSKYLDPYEAGNGPKEFTSRPYLMYNQMIYPLRKLSLRGILWYQGESNARDKIYAKLCGAMLEGWRNDFAQGALPFYFVQMTPYNWKLTDKYADYYAYFRETQEKMLAIENTGMAVTMDVGEPDNIHPQRKKEVGLRLAKIALNKTYGIKSEPYKGPEFRKLKSKGNSLVLSYTKESMDGGLTTNDGKAPRHFYIAGADGVFSEATAKISNNKIILRSDNVDHPVMVRYAFLNAVVTNLQNEEGLPAIPFRTDDLETVKYK